MLIFKDNRELQILAMPFDAHGKNHLNMLPRKKNHHQENNDGSTMLAT